jgi:uncharacterized protein
MYIQVGYGLEGALPDITAFDITEYRIKPRFRANDYEGGLALGIDSIRQAVRGEYVGTGKTRVEKKRTTIDAGVWLVLGFFAFIVFMNLVWGRRRRRGYRYSSAGGPYVGGWSSGSSGGWSSGGGSFSGFSGGGGSFGGGGAGSSW